MCFHLFRLNFETVAKLQLSNRLPHIPNTYGLRQNGIKIHLKHTVLMQYSYLLQDQIIRCYLIWIYLFT